MRQIKVDKIIDRYGEDGTIESKTDFKQRYDRKMDEDWWFRPKYRAKAPQRGYKDWNKECQ